MGVGRLMMTAKNMTTAVIPLAWNLSTLKQILPI